MARARLDRNILRVALTTLAFGLFFSSSQAAPNNTEAYDIIQGGLTNILPGAIVEGSVASGGLQPDYVIDVNEEPLKSLLTKAENIGKLETAYWDKVWMVVDLVQTDFFRYTNYKNPYYRRLLKKYRDLQKDVPLSEYVACKGGVCREHALALHFALKRAGIPNLHAYAKIQRVNEAGGNDVVEDHAFTVVKHEGVDWVVDAYYWGFNGFRLQDLTKPGGLTDKPLFAPIAQAGPGHREILQINSFPKVYNPNACRMF